MIGPAYPLARMLAQRNAISEALADAPRLRLGQITTHFDPTETR